MFIGREEELGILENLYGTDKFECLIMYGRRRVGKTTLLRQFCKDRNAVFFSALEGNDGLNLSNFSGAVQRHFDGSPFGAFADWGSASEYVSKRSGGSRFMLVIDEFPFLAAENPSIKSILQHTIDHVWKDSNIFLVLCGSSVSFMENEVMGYSSPLYGRSTAQLEVKPFDYLDSARFFPGFTNEQKLIAYGILGGIPSYLQQFSSSLTLEQNIAKSILGPTATLKEEPQVLLRMELRDPAVYNSILEAMAGGATRLADIAGKTHEESQKCCKYLTTLRTIRLVDKLTPAGEDEGGKKSIYRITDNYLGFWYRFVFGELDYIEMNGPQVSAQEMMRPDSINAYMGGVFESICRQYLVRKAKAGRLPFVPHVIGRWWGANPKTRSQDDIDILLLDRSRTSAVFCECKFRNIPFDKPEFDDLVCASEIFDDVSDRHYFIFSKGGFTDWVVERAKDDQSIVLVSIDDLFS